MAPNIVGYAVIFVNFITEQP